MKATLKGFREGALEPYYNKQRSGLVPILDGVKDALLKRAEKIIITVEYSKSNDFEIRGELMIKGVNK